MRQQRPDGRSCIGRSNGETKRNKNVKACPNADRWMRNNPDAARNLRRIIKFMDGRYEGSNQGYINRDTNFVEYRFDPIEESITSSTSGSSPDKNTSSFASPCSRSYEERTWDQQNAKGRAWQRLFRAGLFSGG